MFKRRLIGRRNSAGATPTAAAAAAAAAAFDLQQQHGGGGSSRAFSTSHSEGSGGNGGINDTRPASATNSTASPSPPPPCLKKSNSIRTYGSHEGAAAAAAYTSSSNGGNSHSNSPSNNTAGSGSNNNNNNNAIAYYSSSHRSINNSPVGGRQQQHQQRRIKRRRVRFQTVLIREYERIIGDNPSCSSGAPISIGWQYSPEVAKSLEECERLKRWPPREMADLVLTRREREELLLEWGATVHDIIEAIRHNVKAKQQRRRTVTAIGTYDRLEEVMEQASRTIKRTLMLKKSNDDLDFYASNGNGNSMNHHHHRDSMIHHQRHRQQHQQQIRQQHHHPHSNHSRNSNSTTSATSAIERTDHTGDDGSRSVFTSEPISPGSGNSGSGSVEQAGAAAAIEAAAVATTLSESEDVSATVTSSPRSVHSLARHEEEQANSSAANSKEYSLSASSKLSRYSRNGSTEDAAAAAAATATHASSAASEVILTPSEFSAFNHMVPKLKPRPSTSTTSTNREFLNDMVYRYKFEHDAQQQNQGGKIYGDDNETEGLEYDEDTTLPSRGESSVYNDDYELEYDPRYRSFEYAKVVVMDVVEHAASNDSNNNHHNFNNHHHRHDHNEHDDDDLRQSINIYDASDRRDYERHDDTGDEPYYEVKYDEDMDGDDMLGNDISEMSASTFLSQFTDFNHSRRSVATSVPDDSDAYESLIRSNYMHWELCPYESDGPTVQRTINAVVICEEESTYDDDDEAADSPQLPQLPLPHGGGVRLEAKHFAGLVPPAPPDLFLHHHHSPHDDNHHYHAHPPHFHGDPQYYNVPSSPTHRPGHRHSMHQDLSRFDHHNHPIPVTHYNIVDGRAVV